MDQYNCVCTKYGFGHLHKVSTRTTWLQHLNEAPTNEERQRIRLARLLGERVSNIPAAPGAPDSPQAFDDSVPPSVRRAEARRGLAKRAKENKDPNHFIGRRNMPDLPPRFPDENTPDSPPHFPDENMPDSPPHFPDENMPDSPPHFPDENMPDSPPHPVQVEILYERRPRPTIDLSELQEKAVLRVLKDTLHFITALSQATLEDPIVKLSTESLIRLRNPPHLPMSIDNPGHQHSISVYLATEHSSQETYEKVCWSTIRNFPTANGIDDVLSFYKVETLIVRLTGIEHVQHDMCPDSCVAFTGPYVDLGECPICGSSRWNQQRLQGTSGRNKTPAKTFTTIPLGPQLQALYRNPAQARDMRYLYERTQQVLAELRETGLISIIDDIVAGKFRETRFTSLTDDVAAGWDYLGVVLDGEIQENDIVLSVSLDGAQLYESKQSDCWLYIWIILNLSPDKRYKKTHVLPGGFIPGPNKPKNLDSFLFIGMHNLSALQSEGLRIWDSSR
ncbi:hypothetical protein M404DRAFT_930908, partial [Pisolithus tinctorius Marx 270]